MFILYNTSAAKTVERALIMQRNEADVYHEGQHHREQHGDSLEGKAGSVGAEDLGRLGDVSKNMIARHRPLQRCIRYGEGCHSSTLIPC